jgi:hypothetical protein
MSIMPSRKAETAKRVLEDDLTVILRCREQKAAANSYYAVCANPRPKFVQINDDRLLQTEELLGSELI